MRARAHMIPINSFLVCAGLVAAGAAFAGDTGGVQASKSLLTDESALWSRAPDAADDPPGLIGNDRLEHVAGLAAELSRDRSWLSDAILEALDQLSLRLDEVFQSAPRIFSMNGLDYEIKIEKVGDAWADFDPTEDAYLVYLTHEFYDALGDDQVLGFVGGDEEILGEKDIVRLPALGLTVVETTAVLLPAKGLGAAAEIGAPVPLGAVRLAVDRPSPEHVGAPQSKCFLSSTPTSCANNLPVCIPGYEPMFILTGVQILSDHESRARGNPEIEIFPFTRDTIPSDPFEDPPRTNLIFDGRRVTDKFGRSVFLPDVNKKDRWYDVDDFAMLPLSFDPNNLAQVLNGAGTWVASMIEDDDRKGVLETDPLGTETIRIFRHVGGNNVITRRFEYGNVRFIQRGFLRGLFRAFVLGRGDDFFEPMGFTPEVMCRDGRLGNTVIFRGDDWLLRGRFRCAKACNSSPPTCNSSQCALVCGGPGQGFCTAGGQCVCA